MTKLHAVISSVGIANGHGQDGPGIESRWEAKFPAAIQTGPGAHPVSCTMGTRVFPGGKERLARDADPSPPSSAVVKKEWSYTSTSPTDRTAYTEAPCLYRTSVPVQRCTLPLPIPLLPLWTVRPVQSLSDCTTVHFTFTYTSTPPIDRTACTEPQ